MLKTGDKKLWHAYAEGVKPLGKDSKTASGSSGQENGREQPASKKPAVKAQKQQERHTTKNAAPVAFDRRTERRLRRGEIEIDARLDLHGLRQEGAHRALDAFMARHAGRSRCLLVITGKGRGGSGVLRARLADWLAASDHAAKILALRPAAIRHGGDGAFYVMLRR